MKNTNLFIRASRKLYQPIDEIYDRFVVGERLSSRLRRYYKTKTQLVQAQTGNQQIAQLLAGDTPAMVARIGAVELNCLANYMRIQSAEQTQGIAHFIEMSRSHETYWMRYVKESMYQYAGFFPPTALMLDRFGADFLKYVSNVDILAIWLDIYSRETQKKEGLVCQRYCPQAALVPLASLDTYLYPTPWSAALGGKKVLVVHPFTESIQAQYKKRQLIFKNQQILPDFELKTIKAVQSIAGNQTQYKNWFDAYESMCDRIAAEDFDIAIIGAGAYGLPLASFVKTIGKKAVHMGGATQILFGIRGKRWDNKPTVSSLYNEHWIKPMISETPDNHKVVEGGCYW
ncbi:MAG: hypothetical protein AAF921_21885 [Cyanobacteria bacterium P01_D01_bin.44]